MSPHCQIPHQRAEHVTCGTQCQLPKAPCPAAWLLPEECLHLPASLRTLNQFGLEINLVTSCSTDRQTFLWARSHNDPRMTWLSSTADSSLPVQDVPHCRTAESAACTQHAVLSALHSELRIATINCKTE
jgi:hypothetical protein